MAHMSERTAAHGLYFGTYLSQLRKQRGMSTFELQNASGVSSGNIGYMEKGTRGVPRKRAVYDLAEALDLTPDESVLFFERAIGDMMLTDLRDLTGYLFLALVREVDVERVAQFLTASGVPVTPDRVQEELLSIAHDKDYEHVREMLAAELFHEFTIDPRNGEVRVRLAPFAAGLLQNAEARSVEAAVRATRDQEEG